MKISLKQAIQMIQSGQIVAIPTETVYGLAVSLTTPASIQKVFTLKGRPSDNPLIVHISDIKQIKSLVKTIPKSFVKLKKFWPGPLTIVFAAQIQNVPIEIRAGLKTVAIRMPKHSVALKLIQKTGPLAAPSANLSGKPSPTSRQHVEADLGKIFPVLDGGVCENGVESTVIYLKETSWELLRSGAISETEIETALGMPAQKRKASKTPRSPGQKYRHYAPKARLILCRSHKEILAKEKSADAILGFVQTKTKLPKISLGKRGDFKINLKNLYAALRKLDQKKFKTVLVDFDFTKTGLGATLADRLKKAAS